MGIVSFFKFLIFGDQRKKIYMHLDEATIKNNEIIEAQQKKISSQQAQLAQVFAQKKEEAEKKAKIDKESEVNKRLLDQKLDLDAHKHGKIIWLGKFYYDIYVKNRNKPGKPVYFKKSKRFLEITDKNDEVVLGKWGDFGIMEGGKLCLKDSDGNLISYGKSLHHILYKPDGFENQVRRGRFTIPMDKDGNWMEDIEYKEIPEPLYAEFDEETGQIKHIEWSKVKTSEVKKVIADKLEKMNIQSQELEFKDSVISKLKSQMDNMKRSLKVYESEADTAQTDLSKALFRFTETEKRVSDFHSQITKLSELKATYENIIDKKDAIIQNLIDKLEVTGNPIADRVIGQVQDQLEFYKGILPEKVETIIQPIKEPMMQMQPGEIIKK